jgi:hypothetical protein
MTANVDRRHVGGRLVLATCCNGRNYSKCIGYQADIIAFLCTKLGGPLPDQLPKTFYGFASEARSLEPIQALR